jgi:hypothetical protein
VEQAHVYAPRALGVTPVPVRGQDQGEVALVARLPPEAGGLGRQPAVVPRPRDPSYRAQGGYVEQAAGLAGSVPDDPVSGRGRQSGG